MAKLSVEEKRKKREKYAREKLDPILVERRRKLAREHARRKRANMKNNKKWIESRRKDARNHYARHKHDPAFREKHRLANLKWKSKKRISDPSYFKARSKIIWSKTKASPEKLEHRRVKRKAWEIKHFENPEARRRSRETKRAYVRRNEALVRKRSREYYEKNRNQVLLKNKERTSNPDSIRKSRERSLKHKRKLKEQDIFEAMLVIGSVKLKSKPKEEGKCIQK